MKKLIVRSLIFVVLLFIVEKPIGYFISKYVKLRQYDNKLELLLERKIDRDIYIIGSSMAVNGIDPSVIGENTGRSCYNMGFSGSNIPFHVSILKLIPELDKEKTIVLTLNGLTAFQSTEESIYRKDKLYPFIAYDKVLNEIALNSKKNYLASKISWLYRENQNFFDALEYLKNGKNEIDITTDIDENGFIPLDDKVSHLKNRENKDQEYDVNKEEQELIQSLEEFIEICDQNEVELKLIVTPILGVDLKNFRERMKQYSSEEVELIDFSKILSEEKYFFDEAHLNVSGAKMFSKILAQRLIAE